MSASACIAYIGIRFEVNPEEIEGLENRVDQRQTLARLGGLGTFWGNFGGESERYILFVGKQIGVLGKEDMLSVQLHHDDLKATLTDVSVKLDAIGLKGEIGLHLQWLSDQ